MPIAPYRVDVKVPGPNKLVVKGTGEVGIIGVAAAVANDIFYTTGERVREFSITPDDLL